MDELNVNWVDNICDFIYKSCHYESHRSDIKYHMTINTIFSVIFQPTLYKSTPKKGKANGLVLVLSRLSHFYPYQCTCLC